MARRPMSESAYFETLYLLTGENHEYVKSGKFITGVQPYEPFFDVRSTDGSICRGWARGKLAAVFRTSISTRSAGASLDYTAGIALVSHVQLQHDAQLHS